MSYWLIAVPNEGPDTLPSLDRNTKQFSNNHPFKIPSLKVGTLDSLMALSDDLSKYDTAVGGIAKKIEKTYYEMWKIENTDDTKTDQKLNEPPELRVNNVSSRDYIEKFTWNEVRYPKRSSLRTLTDTIIKEASKNDDALKKQVSEYNEIRTSYAAIERRDTGSLLVKPLGQYVKQKDIIEKGHLTTLLVVVPRVREMEFLENYELFERQQAEREEAERIRRQMEAQERAQKEAERAAQDVAAGKSRPAAPVQAKPVEEEKMHDTDEQNKETTDKEKSEEETKKRKLPCGIVVPRSARKLADEAGDEFVLYRVIVLKEGADLYKNLCREKRYTVRPFKYDPEEDKLEKERKVELAKKKKSLWNFLIRWCTTTYAEVFSAWIHIKSVRLYVEAVLRYGLPVNFVAAIMEPQKGKEKQLRAVLKQLYSKLAGSNSNLTTALDQNEVDLSGFGADFYPYVYLPLSLSD